MVHVRDWIVLGAIAAMLGTACGGNDEPTEKPGMVNRVQAEASVRSTTTGVIQAVMHDDGTGALARIVVGAVQAQSIVMATPAEGVARPSAATIKPLGTCACMATSCNFADCEAGAGSVLSGTFTWSATNVQCSGLRYKTATTSGSITVELDCDLHAVDSTLTGFVTTKGLVDIAASGDGVTISDITWSSRTDLDVRYGDGGPTGGSARVNATTAVGPQVFTGQADVLFR
jgi:hypothetical protein